MPKGLGARAARILAGRMEHETQAGLQPVAKRRIRRHQAEADPRERRIGFTDRLERIARGGGWCRGDSQ